MEDQKYIKLRSDSQNQENLFLEATQKYKKQCSFIQSKFLRRKNLSLPRFDVKRITWYKQNLKTFKKKYQDPEQQQVLNQKSQQYIQGFFQNSNSRVLKIIHSNNTKKKQKQNEKILQNNFDYPKLLKMRFNFKKKVSKQQQKKKQESARNSVNFNLLDFGKDTQCLNKIITKQEVKMPNKIFLQNKKLFVHEQIFDNRQGSFMAVQNTNITQMCGQGYTISNQYISFNHFDGTKTKKKFDLLQRIDNSFLQIKNFVIIYGGQTYGRLKGFKNLRDLIIFDLFNQQHIHVNDYSLMYPEKKHHISFLSKNHFYFWGGQQGNQIDNYLYQINIESNELRKKKIKNLTEFRTRHKSVQIGDNDVSFLQKKFDIQNNIKIKAKKFNLKKKHETQEIKKIQVYIFGGMNQNQMATNSMLVLRQKDNNQWISVYPPVQGKPPKPRIDHCFLHFKQLNSLLICGGRSTYDIEFKSDVIYNDMFLFNLSTFCYMKVKSDNEFQPRYNFNSFVYNNNLVIFGGLGKNNYIDNKINCYKINEQALVHYLLLNKSFKKRSVLQILQLIALK